MIAIITNMTTTSLNVQRQEAIEREKELEKLNEYNQQINKLTIEREKEAMRSNLLRAISHDLRTPLTGMIGASATYLEAKDYLDEEAKRPADHGHSGRCSLAAQYGGKSFEYYEDPE